MTPPFGTPRHLREGDQSGGACATWIDVSVDLELRFIDHVDGSVRVDVFTRTSEFRFSFATWHTPSPECVMTVLHDA